MAEVIALLPKDAQSLVGLHCSAGFMMMSSTYKNFIMYQATLNLNVDFFSCFQVL